MTSVVNHIVGMMLDPVHILILRYLILGPRGNHLNSDVSLYKISLMENQSIATLYRRALELLNYGLLIRVNRGNYIATTKAYFIILSLYLSKSGLVDDELAMASLRKLKQAWYLEEFNDEEVLNYVKLLIKGAERRRISLVNVCTDSFSRTVIIILPDKLKKKPMIDAIGDFINDMQLVKASERVIAKALLEFFPTITLNDGCEAAIAIWGQQNRGIRYRVLALKCRMHGYTLGECPVASNLIGMMLSSHLNISKS